jgi:hypothetical protein
MHPLKSMRPVVIVYFSPAHSKFISYFGVVEQVYLTFSFGNTELQSAQIISMSSMLSHKL